MAAAIGAGLPVDGTTGCMIADIGGGTTDVAIIALGGVVASTSIRHAGDKFNEAIIQYIRKRHALLIGDRTAERLKINIGCACMDEDEFGNEIIKTMNARGRDIISGLPKTLEITNKDMMIALQESMDIVVDAIKTTIEKAPPEISADIAENGMMLSGGGANIYNLDRLIKKKTDMEVTIAENSFEAVALGTGKALEDVEKLKIYTRKSKRERKPKSQNMKWMRDHKLIAALLILLVVLALLFTLSVTTGFGEGSFASFLNNGVSKITGFFSSAGSNMSDGVGGIFSGGQLRERIDELEERKRCA